MNKNNKLIKRFDCLRAIQKKHQKNTLKSHYYAIIQLNYLKVPKVPNENQ